MSHKVGVRGAGVPGDLVLVCGGLARGASSDIVEISGKTVRKDFEIT